MSRFVLSQMIDKTSREVVGTLLCDRSPSVRQSDYPWLAYVTFRYSGRPLPTAQEMHEFESVERMIEGIEQRLVIAWVGTMTQGNVRDYIVYCRDRREFKRSIAVLDGTPKHRIRFVRDPGWKQHHDLVSMLGPNR